MSIFSKLSESLKKTRSSLSGAITSMIGAFTKIDEDLFEELLEILIMADVGTETAEKICSRLRKRVKDERVTDPSKIRGMIEEIVSEMMSPAVPVKCGTSPSVILVIGVNGAGKTTTIGKMALKYKKQGKSVILGAADTFRAAAIDQLEVWADRAGVPIVKQKEGSDPAAVVFDTISSAKSRKSDIILCDTAGRLHTKKNLMDELAKISRIVHRELPDADFETLLVLDGTTGQNAANQAKEFSKVAEITGIILTKLDGTAKGGVVVGITDSLGIPVKMIGVGEGIDDLRDFEPEEFAKAIFGE